MYNKVTGNVELEARWIVSDDGKVGDWYLKDKFGKYSKPIFGNEGGIPLD